MTARPPARPSDLAWRLIVNAAGHVQGKVFRMSEGMLVAILMDRGTITQRWHFNPFAAHFLYSVPVYTDPGMRYGEIRLEKLR